MEHSSTSDWGPSSEGPGTPRVAGRGGFSRERIALGIAVLMLALPVNAQPPPSGLRNDVVFTEYFPFSSTAEIVRRLFSPLKALRINQEAAGAGRTLRGQPVDLAKERYSVYVPASPHSSSGAYSLLVFIPPWPRAEVPRNWIPILDRYNTILVTAANSGNEAATFDRRAPLALLAAVNIMAQYPVDPQQVYIGGFSGGSRVALRIALGYPDVFHGALLDAGSDAIGTPDIPLPAADLFRRFQESSRLVYMTGEHDEENLALAMQSQRSLDKWCVFDVLAQTVPRTGHELADSASFSRALGSLLGPRQSPSSKLAECRARIDRELTAQLEQVESARARGESAAAMQLLDKIDGRYGGLAGPRSVELEAAPHPM
jgi:pimeloyl-ACP methyl ester carboxylesterase